MIDNFHNCIIWLREHGEDGKKYEVKEVRDKRTLTQNAYYWVLLSRLARLLRTSNEELHVIMILNYSEVIDEVSADPEVDFTRYYKYARVDRVENGRYIWLCYRRSSEMNTAQFSALVDGLISECEKAGIETITPEELAIMRAREEDHFDGR